MFLHLRESSGPMMQEFIPDARDALTEVDVFKPEDLSELGGADKPSKREAPG